MDVHPTKNGINRYWPIPIWFDSGSLHAYRVLMSFLLHTWSTALQRLKVEFLHWLVQTHLGLAEYIKFGSWRHNFKFTSWVPLVYRFNHWFPRSLGPPSVNFSPLRGNVVLMGDAVHPMMPNLGQGGCQAIEDGTWETWQWHRLKSSVIL